MLKLGGPEDGMYQDIAEAFEDEGVNMPDVDFPAITSDPWGGRDVSATGELGDIDLTHFYYVQLAM
jgi:hypothetical protein